MYKDEKYTGGSACELSLNKKRGIIIKKVNKNEQGIENGYKKLYYEAIHMQEYNKIHCPIYPEIKELYYEDQKLCLSMAYMYNGKTFSDLLLNPDIAQDYITSSLEYILRSLFANFYIKKQVEPSRTYLYDNYMDRVLKRMNKVKKLISEKNNTYKYLEKAIRNGCIINGEFYPSILVYIRFLKKQKEFLDEIMIGDTCESHHDLIMGNILVDIQYGGERIKNFRLIDPRGEKETGAGNRHYMYDMGKMLFGMDCFDLFRQYYSNPHQTKFYFRMIEGGDIDSYILKFDLSDEIIKHYKNTQQEWWRIMKMIQLEKGLDRKQVEREKKRFLFSFAHMYHSDIPCRMIDEGAETLLMTFYVRGMMIMRYFIQEVWKKDVLAPESKSVLLWEE